ncbi:MAG: betaine/proline/choline family ABC transporter ATP-binding protein [Thermacetogeniaceae bacterium]
MKEMKSNSVMVELENVSKIYGNDRVVDNVSFSVKKGEIFVLIGPSGCGKTTTLKMINQLIPHSEGKIIVRGEDVTKLDPVELRRSIGYVIQYIGLLPHLKIRDNITFVLQLKKYPKKKQKERAEELIQTVGLPVSYLDRYPRELSGGQQQRVGVARALAADPEILLMDEPFGAVDPIARGQLQNELLKLQEAIQKTIIFVTHDMQEAFKLGNRIAIMREGKLVTVGTAMEIVKEEDEFVRAFVGRDAIFDALDAVPITQIVDRNVPRLFIEEKTKLPEEEFSKKKKWEFVFVIGKNDSCLGYVNFDELDEKGQIRKEENIFPLPATCLESKASVKKAIEEMLWGGKTWLPVVDDDNKFLGIVTFEGCVSLMAS